jgi:hypothetical protein
MVEFVPSPRSKSSTYKNEQHANEISIALDDSLYIFHPTYSGLLKVEFRGLAFGRNSICFDGIFYNISSVSLSLPFPDLDLNMPLRNCVFPRQVKRIVSWYNGPSGVHFIPFESESQLTRIDSWAFSRVEHLRSICLPRSVETICMTAFSGCQNLWLLSFERGSRLTRIESGAFCMFSSLRSIRLPASLQILDPGAFPRANFRHITIEEGSRNFRVWGDFLMDVECVTLVRYFGDDRNVTLSSEIETLGTGCFSECSDLSSLVFERGSKLKRIEAQAFSDCSGLKSICIPASVEILCRRCFAQCHALSFVTFAPESKLNEIEEWVFYFCIHLTSLSIPASVTIIQGSAFAFSGISKIAIEEGNANFAGCRGFLINVTDTSVVRYFGHRQLIGWMRVMGLRRGVASICHECLPASSFAFGPGLKLTRIGACAFADYSRLQSISMPASVESLGVGSFSDCSALSSVTFELGSKLVRIEARTFFDCRSLRSISIPASVESLDEKWFSQCNSLSSLTFELGSNLARIHARVFERSPLLKSIVIPCLIQELVKDWALKSSLDRVTFESAASLQRMLDGDCVDLSGSFVNKIGNCDSDIASLGSSIGRRFKHFSHLTH